MRDSLVGQVFTWAISRGTEKGSVLAADVDARTGVHQKSNDETVKTCEYTLLEGLI